MQTSTRSTEAAGWSDNEAFPSCVRRPGVPGRGGLDPSVPAPAPQGEGRKCEGRCGCGILRQWSDAVRRGHLRADYGRTEPGRLREQRCLVGDGSVGCDEAADTDGGDMDDGPAMLDRPD